MRLMDSPEVVIDRMCAAVGAPTKAALAAKLGIAQQVISNWIAERMVPPKWIFQVAQLSGWTVERIATGYDPEPKSELVREAEAAYAIAPDVTRTLLDAIEQLGPVERETLARCAEALRAGDDEVRRHLSGQLKLLADLVEARKAPSARPKRASA